MQAAVRVRRGTGRVRGGWGWVRRRARGGSGLTAVGWARRPLARASGRRPRALPRSNRSPGGCGGAVTVSKA
jgi:hypothetical protein